MNNRIQRLRDKMAETIPFARIERRLLQNVIKNTKLLRRL